MPSYTCLIFSHESRVLKIEAFERGNDTKAEEEAIAIMIRTPNTRGYELWCGGTKIAAHLTKRSPS